LLLQTTLVEQVDQSVECVCVFRTITFQLLMGRTPKAVMPGASGIKRNLQANIAKSHTWTQQSWQLLREKKLLKWMP